MRASSMQSASQWSNTLLERSSLSLRLSSVSPRLRYISPRSLFSICIFKVRPSVEEVQKMLNSIGQTITSVSKGVGTWKKLERPKKSSDKVILC